MIITILPFWWRVVNNLCTIASHFLKHLLHVVRIQCICMIHMFHTNPWNENHRIVNFCLFHCNKDSQTTMNVCDCIVSQHSRSSYLFLWINEIFWIASVILPSQNCGNLDQSQNNTGGGYYFRREYILFWRFLTIHRM